MTQPSPAVPVDRRAAGGTRGIIAALLAGVLALTGLGAAVPARAAVSAGADVVINEIYGGGGNSGATHNRDFVELLNTTDRPVNLAGWSVQYASSGGGTWQVTPLGDISIAAGGSVLVGEAPGANTALPGFEADVDGSLALSGSQGKVALVTSETAIAGATGIDELEPVADLVGWGAASDFAGAGPAPATTNATAITRTAGANTADNAADFTLAAATPLGGGAIPNTTEPEDPGDPEEPVPTGIADIQGTADTSPLVGRTVLTEGVVTARYPGLGDQTGYVVQTAGTGGALDDSHAASDAVFVSSAATVGEVAVGDSIRVTGVVAEQFGVTRLDVAAGGVEKLTEPLAAPVPASVAWPADEAGRERIESMLVQPQGTFTVSDTFSTNQYGEVGLAAGDVPLRQPTDAADAGSAAAAEIAADNAARAVILDDGAATDFLDAVNSALTPPFVSLGEPLVVGGTATFDRPVIVHYDFDAWRFLPTQQVVGDGSGADDGVTFSNPRTPAPAEVGGNVSVASFNVLNYFTTLGTDNAACRSYDPAPNGQENSVRTGCDQRGAWDADDLARQQSKIVAAIEGLDAAVVGLMEIENSAKVDGADAADEATATLVAALNAAAGSTKWAYVRSSDELPAPSLQDVITNAIIYQPALVSPVGDARALGTASGAGQAFDQAREPIGQVFAPARGGEAFLFVVNHFKSKGSAATARPGDQEANSNGQGASNLTRVEQARALDAWVDSIQGDAESVLLAGDFNSYGQEDPLQVLYDAGYVDAEQHFELGESSYSFDGLAGSLDHVLLNDAAAKRATGADIWNINSGESIALEYSRYGYHGTLFHAGDVYRSSDHDPVKVGLSAGAEAPVELTLLGINDFHGRIDANTVNFAGTLEEQRAAASGPALFLSSGDNIGASLFASAVQQDQPTIDVLNALELQTSAVGNHEFDRGFADLTGRVSDAADFSYLGANVYEKGTQTPALDEYELLDIGDGLVVGVIGAVTEETPALVTPSGVADLDFGDPVDAVNRVSADLSDGDESNGEADVLVALYHDGAGAGTPDGATLDEELAAGGTFAEIVNDTVADVDAIFTGHTHKEYAWEAAIPGTDRTRPIVQTGSYGANIGKITLSVVPSTGEVTAHTQENVARTTTPAADLIATYPRVAEVNGIVTDALAYAAEIGNQPVGAVTDDITTAFGGGAFVDGVWTGGSRDDRASESSLGNLVAESIRSSLADLPDGAQIGVTNPGGLRAELYDTQAEFGATAVPGLQDGQISYSQALAVLPFNNTMGLVTLTGAQFDTLLEQQWQRNPDGTIPSRPYLQLGLSDNVTYTFDASRPEGDRITSITVDGVPVDPAAPYRVGTLSFLIAGGDNFRVFTEGADAVDTGLLDYEAWVNYLGENSPVSPSFAKHAVSVAAPLEGPAGGVVSLPVSGLNLTSRGAIETTQLAVAIDGTSAGTVTVTSGATTVPVAVPAGAAVGDTVLVTLTAPETGTVVTIPIDVLAGDEPAVASTTRLLAVPSVHLNRLLPATLVALVRAPGAVTTGTVEFREGAQVVGTASVRNGVATYRLPKTIPRGTHTYTAVFVPSDPATVTGSTSGTVRVRALF
ncbi:ExeM/NucH family extracellular endonuclease [Microbacterium sp. RD1]|uniref:ExeM/NucH family extracellular endonuclease n=1 Tax=Microbacterium sp. RD1 TaxID=3457313 RepID=UPI003FA5AD26